MTEQQTDRDQLRAVADHAEQANSAVYLAPRDLLALLDQLDQAEARIKAVQHLIDQADEMGEWAITCTRLQWAVDGSNPPPGA